MDNAQNTIIVLIHLCHKFLELIYVTNMDVVDIQCFKQNPGRWIMSEITVIVKLFVFICAVIVSGFSRLLQCKFDTHILNHIVRYDSCN
jgi:hypothetical protein